MSRIANEVLTQNNDNSKGKGDNYTYALVVVNQLGQLRHAR